MEEEAEAKIIELAMELIDLAGVFIHGLDHHRISPNTIYRHFIAAFGVTARHAAWLWVFCECKVLELDQKSNKKHLLWTLNLLKTDDTEHALHGQWKADEKTLRKWTNIFLKALSELGVVSDCFLFLLVVFTLQFV